MALIDVAELAPVQRLLAIAYSDAGQTRIVASFLLAWRNVQACGGSISPTSLRWTTPSPATWG